MDKIDLHIKKKLQLFRSRSILHLLYKIDGLMGYLYDGLSLNILSLNILSLGWLPVALNFVFIKKVVSILWGDGHDGSLSLVLNFNIWNIQVGVGLLNLMKGVVKTLQEGIS